MDIKKEVPGDTSFYFNYLTNYATYGVSPKTNIMPL